MNEHDGETEIEKSLSEAEIKASEVDFSMTTLQWETLPSTMFSMWDIMGKMLTDIRNDKRTGL